MPKAGAEPRRSMRPGEDTGPFELARVRPRSKGGEPDAADPRPPASPGAAGPDRQLLPGARRAAWLATLNTLLYLCVAGLGVLRHRADPDATFEVVLAVLALGLAFWGASASRHLFRAARGGPDAGHALASAFGSIRSVFIFKGTGLFLLLAISCFAFSAILSVFAFL